MIKELNLNCPYKVYEDSEKNIYYFYTLTKVRYIAYFTDADEYFPDFYLKNNIYTFGFEPEKNKGKTKRILADNNIKLTLISIIQNFFKNSNNVLTFVADISDLKQKARNRLFEIWKNQYDIKEQFEKYDIEIETDDESYYSSMLISRNNMHKSEYIKAFLQTTEELKK